MTQLSRRVALALMLACALVLFTACQDQTQYQMASAPTQNVNQVTAVPVTVEEEEPFDYDSYDPASEEGIGDDLDASGQVVTDLSALLDMDRNATVYNDPTGAPTMNSVYAGATPVIIDPIDKPTPTPVPPLTFSEYIVYDATKLGISFEAPTGWIVDDVEQSVYLLTNPDPSVDYQATERVSAYTVNTEYSQSDLAKEVRNVLSTLRADFSSFSPTNTATRSLLDKTGVYADFSGVTKAGQSVAGRVHAVCVNKKLYILEMTYPKAYTETYKDTVYKRFRHSVKITK
ncbi:MAG: hypothetical protein IJ229_09925 [Clostridia bacterium]|nr:hypothetical protein [Clostridia bacterium]MBR1686161.1 hypothetical protein [Clostridia bacterium]